MNNTDYEKRGVKEGDTIRIIPRETVPNADRVLKIDRLTPWGIEYGATTTNDSYYMPYSWIKSFRIIKRK